jgi:hypothetical protein
MLVLGIECKDFNGIFVELRNIRNISNTMEKPMRKGTNRDP